MIEIKVLWLGKWTKYFRMSRVPCVGEFIHVRDGESIVTLLIMRVEHVIDSQEEQALITVIGPNQ